MSLGIWNRNIDKACCSNMWVFFGQINGNGALVYKGSSMELGSDQSIRASQGDNDIGKDTLVGGPIQDRMFFFLFLGFCGHVFSNFVRFCQLPFPIGGNDRVWYAIQLFFQGVFLKIWIRFIVFCTLFARRHAMSNGRVEFGQKGIRQQVLFKTPNLFSELKFLLGAPVFPNQQVFRQDRLLNFKFIYNQLAHRGKGTRHHGLPVHGLTGRRFYGWWYRYHLVFFCCIIVRNDCVYVQL
mmetsp:Transcript_30426/g.72968  ORF Transcript_30426/g.72968 Transcript_30426/m.72968 type:complete len:239 (+) Transcript_30426:397-1113(+)